jgi:ferredoxin
MVSDCPNCRERHKQEQAAVALAELAADRERCLGVSDKQVATRCDTCGSCESTRPTGQTLATGIVVVHYLRLSDARPHSHRPNAQAG